MSASESQAHGVAAQESDILWYGHPWVVPALVGYTIAAILAAVVLTWLELRLSVAFAPMAGFPVLLWTYAVAGLIWLVSTIRLAIYRASTAYTLRRSSLDIRHGIVGKKVYTLSAAGFSDLEVIQGISGRILNMGDIVMETDSDRDLRLRKVKSPTKVSAMIRQVMTVPMVRLAPDIAAVPLPSKTK